MGREERAGSIPGAVDTPTDCLQKGENERCVYVGRVCVFAWWGGDLSRVAPRGGGRGRGSEERVMGREIKGAMERKGKAGSSPGAVDTPTHCLQQKRKEKRGVCGGGVVTPRGSPCVGVESCGAARRKSAEWRGG